MSVRRIAPFLLLLVSLPAAADELQRRAREHFALAEAAEKRGDMRTAIDEYKLAYSIKAHPTVLYDIAVDYEKLEQWDAAIEYYRRYLTDSGDAPDKARVSERVQELEQKLQSSRPPPPRGEGFLLVESDVHARVLVDGTELGTTPLKLKVPAGHHRVTLELDGYQQVEREVDVGAGGSEQVKEKLPRLPGTPDPKPDGPPASRWSIGLDYGFDVSPNVAMRAVVTAGFRMLDEHVEIGLLYGYYGSGNLGYGGEVRFYSSNGVIRPYLGATVTDGSASDGTAIIGGEITSGALFVLNTDPGSTIGRVQYNLEGGVRYLFSGVADATSSDHRPQVALSLSVGFLIPF